MEPRSAEEPVALAPDSEPEPPLATTLAEPAPPAPIPPPPRVWTVFLAAASLLVAIVVADGILFGIVAALQFQRTGYVDRHQFAAQLASPPLFLAMLGLTGVVHVALSLLAARLSPEPLRERLALGRSGLGLRATAVASVGLLLFAMTPDALLGVLGVARTGSLELLDRSMRELPAALFPVAILLMGLLAPLGEELVFRGYIQTRLCRRWGGWPGITVAAALFALFHFDWLHSPYAFVVGLFLGWLALRTGSIVPSIAAHAFNNSMAVLTSWASSGGTAPRWVNGVWLVVNLAGAVAAVAWLRPRVARAASALEVAAPPPPPEMQTPLEPVG